MRQKILFFPLFVASISIITSGCKTTWKPLSTLHKDLIEENKGYSAIICFRLQVTNKATFTRAKNPYIEFSAPYQVASEKPPHRIPLDGEWRNQEGLFYFDELVCIEARSGEYRLESVGVDLVSEEKARGQEWEAQLKGRNRSYSLIIPIRKSCTIDSGRLAYLGTLAIEVFPDHQPSMLKVDFIMFNYRFKSLQTEDGFSNDLSLFGKRYPLLYERFKTNANMLPLHPF